MSELNFVVNPEHTDETILGNGKRGPITVAMIKANAKNLPIPDLATRPIYIQPAPATVIPFDAVVIVGDSPFGFRFDSMKATWPMYDNKAKLRAKTVSCTSTEFFNGWNAVKKLATYTEGAAFFQWFAAESTGKVYANVSVFGIGANTTARYEAKEDFQEKNTARRDRYMNFLRAVEARKPLRLISEVDEARIVAYVAEMDAATEKLTREASLPIPKVEDYAATVA